MGLLTCSGLQVKSLGLYFSVFFFNKMFGMGLQGFMLYVGLMLPRELRGRQLIQLYGDAWWLSFQKLSQPR